MELECRDLDDALIVGIRAERIDSAVAISFKDAVRAASGDGPERVILDLGDVAFVDSSGLGAIVAVMKFLGPEQRLELAGLNPDVEKVFHLTRMDTIFVIHDNIGAATSRAAG